MFGLQLRTLSMVVTIFDLGRMYYYSICVNIDNTNKLTSMFSHEDYVALQSEIALLVYLCITFSELMLFRQSNREAFFR